MNTRLNKLVMTSAALLLSLAWTGNLMAQDRTLTQDRTGSQQRASTMPAPGMDRVSCSEVDWHRDMLRDYPWVADACHEAIIVDGKKWARFEAEFQQLNRDGTIDSNFRNDRGRSLGSVSLQPGPDQRVLLDGRSTRFSELRRGQVLNFYVPDGEFTFVTEPGAPTTDQVQIVQRRDEQPARELAQAERTTTERRDRLPATAGPLPILALGGLLSLLGGFSLTMRRRFTKTNA
jgi:hypothetical protein